VRALRAALVLATLAAALAALVSFALWTAAARGLPNPVDSALDVESALRISIESDRRGAQLAAAAPLRAPVRWDRPDASRLPRRLLELFVTETGCPGYLRTPAEEGWRFTWRVGARLALGLELDGDGACELSFARMLARRLGATTELQQAVAADRIHRVLGKEELVAFNLQSVQLERGLVGVEDAAPALLQRALGELDDAELAELQLAIPPWALWDDVKHCANAPQLRQTRDQLLRRTLPPERARAAMARPLRCLAVRRGP
jgi:Transglycosylase